MTRLSAAAPAEATARPMPELPPLSLTVHSSKVISPKALAPRALAPRALTPKTGETRVRTPRRSPIGWWYRRTEGLPPWVVVTQLFFGLGWLRAVAEKVRMNEWWSGETVIEFASSHSDQTLTWIQPLLGVALPLAPITAAVVLVAELGISTAMIMKRQAEWALLMAMVLNIVFVAVGAVNPSVFYLLGHGALLLWMLGRQPSPELSSRLRLATAGAAAVAIINVPLIGTIHPATVVDDPAMMMITISCLAAVGLECTHRAVFGRTLP